MARPQPSRPNAGERLAAAGALLAVAGAVVIVLAGVARNVLAVLVIAASLLLFVGSGWYAISRRGVRRLAAGLVMACLLALFAVTLALADTSIVRGIIAAALSVLSVIAARYALRRTPKALGSAADRYPAAPPCQHPVLIMNLKSGGGKAQRFRLAEECRARGIEPVILEPGDDLLELAEGAVARGADVLGMAGGDGSQALVAGVAARHDVPFVCVPAGTRNHFALDLGLDRDDVVGSLTAFSDGVQRRVDLATVNGRTFVNNASLGLYASVVDSPDYRDAKLKTAAARLPDLLGPGAAGLDLPFTGPDGAAHQTAQLILVSNNPYQLTHAGGRGTRKHMDLGVLGVATAVVTGPADATRFAALQAAGRVGRFPGWQEWSAPTFEIRSDGPVQIAVDGETLQLASPLLFQTRPGALRVQLPAYAMGISPAARAVRVMAGSTVAELARVIGGNPA